MKPPPCLSADEIAAIAARYRGALCAEAPAVRESASSGWRFFTAELGARMVPAGLARRYTGRGRIRRAGYLVFANVFGLTYIRLQDALSDGEIGSAAEFARPPGCLSIGKRHMAACSWAIRRFGRALSSF